MKRLSLALAMISATFVATAGSQSEHERVESDPDSFPKQRASLVKEIQYGERYSEISREDSRQVLEALDRMGQLVATVTSLDQLNPKQRVDLFNYQELVNNLLTAAAEDSRLICTRETRVGTHRRLLHAEP